VELLTNLGLGLQTAFTLTNLLYCLGGVFLGTLIGVLPGLGPTATIAMLLPITFGLPPVSSLIMLAGIYYGSQYGGSTTAILVNLPGEAASVVTALDGYQMARKGHAGKALATAAIGSFFAGSVATVLIALFAPPLAQVALEFGPPDYFSLMVLGLVAAVVLAHGSLLHAFGMVVVGLLLGLIGTDVNSGAARYTFDLPQLADGIGFVIVAMGMFGLGEIVRNLENETTRSVMVTKIQGLWPTKADFKRMWAPILRGTALGSVLGILPGSGSILGSFASYSLEKRVAKDPSRFGPRRHRRCGGPRVGQQRRRADFVHSDVDPRHSVQSGDGADDRRDDHPGDPARSIGDHGTAGFVLGHHRVDVDRQLLPYRAQPAVDRAVGTTDHGAVPLSLSGDPGCSAASACSA